VGGLLAESHGAGKATAPVVVATLLEEELQQQEVGAPIGAWAMRCLLRAHGERKGADEIESVRIRRATAASVMPSVGGEVRVSVTPQAPQRPQMLLNNLLSCRSITTRQQNPKAE
jgi:hypothetical protein